MHLKLIIRQWRKVIPYKDAIIFIGLVVFIALFYTTQIGWWTNLPYRPGSEFSDLTITFFPNITYIKQVIVEHRQIPLWRTLLFGGSPLDSDPQSGIWYPLNILYFFVPTEIGFNLLIVFHIAMGGLGMWKWGEAEQLSLWGKMFSMFGFILMPKMIAHLGFGHMGLFYAANYVPWLFWAVKKIFSDSVFSAGRLGAIWGLQFLANPQLAFYGALACGVYILLNIVFQSDRRLSTLPIVLAGMMRRFFVVIGIGALIICVQLLPMIRYAPLSGRSMITLEDSAISSLPINYLWGFFIHDRTGYMEYMTYIGLPVLVLAAFSLRNKKAQIAGVICGVAIVYAMGIHTPLYEILYKLIPFLGWVRSPARILFVVNTVLFLLAGMGLDVALDRSNKLNTRTGRLLLFSFIFLPLLFSLFYQFEYKQLSVNFMWFGIICALTFFALWVYYIRQVPRGLLSLLIVIFSIIDLWIIDASLLEGRSVIKILGDLEGVKYLISHKTEPFRVYSPSYSINRMAGAYFQIESADGVDPLYWIGYDRYMQFASGVRRTRYEVTIPAMEGGTDISQVNRNAIPNSRLLGLINVKFVLAEFPIQAEGLKYLRNFGNTYVYQNEYFQPRWSIAFDAIGANSFDAALAMLRTNLLPQTVIVENQSIDSLLYRFNLHSHYDITPLQVTPNRLEFNINLDNSTGYFVLRQTWHPDWKAFLDSKSVPILRVDGVNMGVLIEQGNHKLVFAYQPTWTYIGGFLTFLGWSLFFYLWIGSVQRC